MSLPRGGETFIRDGGVRRLPESAEKQDLVQTRSSQASRRFRSSANLRRRMKSRSPPLR
jgi:hypothetical protein